MCSTQCSAVDCVCRLSVQRKRIGRPPLHWPAVSRHKKRGAKRRRGGGGGTADVKEIHAANLLGFYYCCGILLALQSEQGREWVWLPNVHVCNSVGRIRRQLRESRHRDSASQFNFLVLTNNMVHFREWIRAYLLYWIVKSGRELRKEDWETEKWDSFVAYNTPHFAFSSSFHFIFIIVWSLAYTCTLKPLLALVTYRVG